MTQLSLLRAVQPRTSMRVPTVVTNDVLFHEPSRRILQDVVTCIRHNVTIDESASAANATLIVT